MKPLTDFIKAAWRLWTWAIVLYIKFVFYTAVLAIIFMIFSSCAHAKDGWFCENDSSKRDGGTYWACGVGESVNEGDARRYALKHAAEEFEIVCDMSTDCNGKPRTVEPKRTSCERTKEGIYKCVRMLEITLLNR